MCFSLRARCSTAAFARSSYHARLRWLDVRDLAITARQKRRETAQFLRRACIVPFSAAGRCQGVHRLTGRSYDHMVGRTATGNIPSARINALLVGTYSNW